MKTVLIADDSQFMRTWLKNILQQHNFKVVAEAKDGQEAIEQYKQVKPDIVLLDITMPNVDGLTALKGILEIDFNAKVIMCSSMGTQSNIIKALEYGAKDFIVKPYFNGLTKVLKEIAE